MTITLAGLRPPTLRPVSWRRLGWVAWRRYRPALTTSAAILGIFAIYLLIRGFQTRHAYAAVQACTPVASAACGFAFSQFHDSYGNVGPIGGVLIFIPGLIGAFAGAPLLAREFETGTFRYAWTQGVGRMRWLTALLIPGALGVAMIGAALGALVTWSEQPLVDSGILQRLHAAYFPVTGITVAAWAVLGFSLGAIAGALIRRTVPALVATLGVWTGFAFLASHLRRQDYQAPLVTHHLQLGLHDFPVDQWWTHGGVRTPQSQLDHVLQAAGAPSMNGGNIEPKPGPSGIDPVSYLIHHGYVQWTSYQPDGRYWTFQSIEFAWLIALSVALLAATLWILRRRNA